MANFDEKEKFSQQDSVMGFFADESNQKDVLNEISAFGDEELNASFKRLFEASEKDDDSYLIRSGRVTARQISQMTSAPEPELQKDILQRSLKEDILLLLGRFHLCMAAEYMLLRRGDMELLRFYFERYELFGETQEYLVKKALRDEMFENIFLNYISFRPLVKMARMLLIMAQNDKLTAAYVARYPLGTSVINGSCCFHLPRIDFVAQHLAHPEDKLALALAIRATPKCAHKAKYAWALDVRAELTQLAGRDDVCITHYLTADEEVFLAELPETNLLKMYAKRSFLSQKAEKALLRHNDKELAEAYFETRHYSLGADLVEWMIKEDLDQAFLVFAQHSVMTYQLFRLLQKSASGKIKALLKKQPNLFRR